MENLAKDGIIEQKDTTSQIKKYIKEGEYIFPFPLFIIFNKTIYANLLFDL